MSGTRRARVVLPGFPHHITHRGNRREDIFFDKEDRREYLDLLSRYQNRYGTELWAFCLMTNHIHLISERLIPIREVTMIVSPEFKKVPVT
jgi:REP element-mobilizing transposase RayT